MRINLKEWLPDQPPMDSPGSEEIKNCYPIARGYKPIRALVEISNNPLALRAKGYYATKASDGATLTFAGDAENLYSYSLVTFTNINRTVGGAYTTQDEDQYWEFVQFGDRLIATSIENPPQYYDLTISTHFEDLPGSPPRARHVGVVRDFVVLANTNILPSEVHWSGDNDSEGWTILENQSDKQTLQDGGWIQGVIGGEVGYLIQERQIVKMTYVGPPVIFQFDVIEAGYGCSSPYSICRIHATAFYRGHDGFYMLDLVSGNSKAIGSEKVDAWFKANANGAYSKHVRGAVDPGKKLVWWSFHSNNSATINPDHVIGFNWELGRWFHAEFDHELLTAAFTEAITLDEIDAFFPNIDDCPISLDSDYWMGGLPQLRAFTTDHYLALFEGDNLEATVQTPEGEPVPGRRSMITVARPLCDTSAATLAVQSRERLANDPGTTIDGIMESNGDVSIMSSGRYHRAQVVIPAGTEWTYIQGVDFEAVDDGAI